MKTRKKLLSVLLTAALVLSVLPGLTLPAAAAYTAEYNIESSSVYITDAGNYRIYGTGAETGHNINIGAFISGDVNITLDNVNINSSSFAFLIQNLSATKLTLVGTNILKSGSSDGDKNAGIEVRNGGSLTITKESTGSLSATGSSNAAGIGGSCGTGNPSRGMITIEGGTVTAQGGYCGAGIGGGYYARNNSSSGVVFITGGNVIARGGTYGAGIGTGGNASSDLLDGDSGLVYITGGTVTAEGGSNGGAGIGAGAGGSCGAVFISGGVVKATGTYTAAGIGSGSPGGGYQGASLVNISGGDVTAAGGSSGGAGIGSGCGSDACTVIISGGGVSATGYGGGAGIGGGNSGYGGGDGGTVTITGGTVTAVGSTTAPDIGGGASAGTNGSLYIYGSSVNANVADAVYQDNTETVQVYETTVAGLPVGSVVSCAVGDGDSFEMKTDASGALYLWLPESAETTLDITAGKLTYVASGEILSDGTTVLAADDPLEVTTDSLSYGVVDTAYSLTLTAEGGTAPYTWSATGLPDGLSLNADTGVVSGTPTETGTHTISVTVTDDDGNFVTESRALTIYSESIAVPRITVANGIAFTVTLYDTDGKYAGTTVTDYGTITGTISGSDTILTGTLTGVPTAWTEVALSGGKVMLRSVTAPSASVDDPFFE